MQPQPHPSENAAATIRPVVHTQPTAAFQHETPSAPPRAIDEPSSSTEVSRLDAAPEPPKASTPAREIRLELAGGERRVEVKLSDRGGEVRVAVRTPDVHLAERLRDNLPALSSRLAESGFRTEAWHPAAAPSDWRQTAESGAASSGNESQSHHGNEAGQQQREESSHRQQHDREDQQPKKKGRDLEWQTHWTASAAAQL